MPKYHRGVFVNQFLPNVSAKDYFADNLGFDVPLLSQSIASEMVTKSPWHAHRKHPKLGAKNVQPTQSQKLGAIVHALLLGQDDVLDIHPVDAYRTKEAKALRDASFAAGRIPVKNGRSKDEPNLASEYEEALEHAARIDNALRKQFGIELGRMQRELTALWSDDDVLCKARFDAFDGTTVFDIKTCSDASTDSLARRIIDHDYHLQGATYISAAEHIAPRMAGRINFVALFVENETSAIVPVKLSPTFLELGRQRWEQSVLSWKKCLSTGYWPCYAGDSPLIVDPPQWYETKSDSELMTLRDRTGAYV